MNNREERRRDSFKNQLSERVNDRGRRRSRSRSLERRDRSRSERSYEERKNWRESSSGDSFPCRGEFEKMPTSCVMIKGLPTHTTEPKLYSVLAAFVPQNIRLISQRNTGECRGFAFVEFSSVEYAKYFMSAFAGSSGGDSNAPQLIVDNRAVILEYAREPSGTPVSRVGSESSKKEVGPVKSDWLCDECGGQNFARRSHCYRCGTMKGINALSVTATLATDPFADVVIVSSVPSSTLAVRGLPIYTTENQITDLLRQFAPVKSVFLVRDHSTGISRGIAFVEFSSIEYSSYVMSNSSSLTLDGSHLKVHFAKSSVIENLPSLQQQQLLLNQFTANRSYGSSFTQVQHQAYATVALQAAQWSSSFTGSAPTSYIAPPFQTPKTTWPLSFETNGASYVFQSQTGLFYDPYHRYYYCPKSKLYYNEVEGNYLTISNQSGTESFMLFHPPDPSSLPETIEEIHSNVQHSARKPVSLSLNLNSTKVKSSHQNEKKRDFDNSTINPVVALTSMRKVSQDLVKWDERKSEINEQFITQEEHPPKFEISTNPWREDSESSHICTLCRRQFSSAELLNRHEKESKLHASNLAKMKLEATSGSGSEPIVYRDRASERRAIHGRSDDQNNSLESEQKKDICQQLKKRKFRTMPEHFTGPEAPILADDPTNPGNQLLRKMGWSDGKGLGKDSSGRVESIAQSLNTLTKSSIGVEALQVSDNLATKARYERIFS